MAINSLKATTSGTINNYDITLPSGGIGGTLYVNGTAFTGTTRSLTPTEATQLSFQPSGTAGNYSFTFTATDNSSRNATSAVATYALSVGQGSCGQASGLDFSTRTANEDWKSRSVTVNNVTIGTSGYSAGATSPADRFDIESLQGGAQSSALTWFTDYTTNTASTSQVTFTFSRPLTGFTIVVQDIDAATNDNTATFIDQVQFDGYASGATTPLALAAANVKLGTTNTFSGNNRVTGNALSGSTPANNVIVTFPQAIAKLTLTYRNTQTAATDPNQQGIGIPSFGWCAEADIATTLTGPTRAQASSTVAYTVTTKNNGTDVPTTTTPTLQLLPTGLAGVTVNNGNGGSYNSTSGLVTFPAISALAVNATVTNTVSFTMPASNAVTGTAAYTSTVVDNTTANNTATLATAQNQAPVASNVTNSPAILSSTTGQTNIAPFSASDPDATTGNTTIVSYTILTLPTAAQGTLYVGGTAATVNQVITVPTSATTSNPGYQLSFVPNGTPGNNATFTYKAIDDVGVSSKTAATYTVLVTPGADLVSVVNGQAMAVEGQSKVYGITTTNNGPAAATNVVATLTLSGKPSFSSVTVTNGSYDAASGVVTFNTLASLASGAAAANTVTVVVPLSPNSFTVKATNSSATADPDISNNNGSAPAANLGVTVSPIGPAGAVSACGTPGQDLSPTITANPNTYYPATNQTVAVGATSLGVGTPVGTTPIANGDLLLVMQMQGADINDSNTDAYGDGVVGGAATSYIINSNFTAGQYEYVVAAGPVTNGTLPLKTGLKYGYQNADAVSSTSITTGTGQRRFQVVRIPQYKNLTISGTVSPAAWDGRTGGILTLDVTGQLVFETGAQLDASGLGFRGGAGQQLTSSSGLSSTDYRVAAPTSSTSTTGAHAMKGEGIVGTPRYVNTGTALFDTGVDGYPSGSAGRGAPGNAGGGGNDATPNNPTNNSGGGGGGNGARGGRGGNAWSSGAAVGGEPGVGFSAPSTSRLILGGGGGAGVNNSGSGTNPASGYASSGAAGGGIVLVRTGSVRGTGTVLANGASAANTVANDGSGGAGAGGSILITANNTASLSTLTLAANGGTGGSNSGGTAGPHGPGGGGGGGVILTNAAPNSASVAPGANGTTGTTPNNVAYGATAGTQGIANSQVSKSIAGSTAGINCSADVMATISAPASATVAQTVSLSVVFANNGGVDASTITRTVTLASGSQGNPVTGVTAPGSNGISSPDATTGAVTITYLGLPALAAGSSTAFGISYTAPGTSSVLATAAVTTTTTEPVTDNNSSTANTAINGYADVVTTVFGLASSTTGQPTATYEVAFANNGPAAAASVTRTVTLPVGAILTPAQLKAITDQGNVNNPIVYDSNTRVINFGTATLANHAATIFQFSYTAPKMGGATNLISNTSTTTAQDASGGTGQTPDQFTFAVTNNASSDLAISGVTTSAATVVAGQPASFILNFINYGPADVASMLRLSQLTPGLSGVSVTGGGSYDPATGIITYPPIGLANGTGAPSTVTFTAPATGSVYITGSVGGGAVSSGLFDNNQATGSIAVTPLADVTTTLTGPTSAVAGNLVTFALAATNSGLSAAAAVVQSVRLPKNLTGVFPSGNGTYNAATGLVTYPALSGLAPGAFVNNTVSFLMPSAPFTAAAFVTTATLEAAGTTANDSTKAATTTTLATTTTDQANVYNTLAYVAQNVAPGAAVTFTIVTGNHGPNTALNVVQQLALRPGLSVASITNSGTYDPATGVITFPGLASQASGASVTNTVVLTAPASGPLVAVASVASGTSDPVPADNVVVLPVTIFNRVDVATTLVGPSRASSTQKPSFTVTTSNKGPMLATSVVQTVAIPAGFAPANVTTTGGGVYDSATGLITWPTVAVLAPEEVKTYTYSYLAPALLSTDANNPYIIVSRATVTSATTDLVTTNNAVDLATEIKWNADVAVAVAGPAATAILGNAITFTVSTINNGPAPTTNVATTVLIDTGLSNVTASGGGVYDTNTGIVTFPTIANQAVGVTGAVTNTITLLVPDRPLIGVSAAANSLTNDINLTNNAATIVVAVTPRTGTLVDLQTTITSNLTSQNAGQPIVLTAKSINAGTTASNMRQRVTLPAGLSSVVATDANGSALPGAYDPASGTVTLPLASSQAAGTTLTYTITVNDPGNDPLVATASVNGNFSDPTPANNTQTVSVTIVPIADVATRISGPGIMLPSGVVTSQMLPGGLATYQVVTINNGPSLANSVAQTVQLPTGLSIVAISGSGSYDASSGLVTFPTIATQAVGAFGEVANTISFIFPTTSTSVVGIVKSGTSENGATANNTAALTTTLTNRVPLANTTTNRLQTPEGNTAAPLALSALTGFDIDGSVASFTIGTLPAAAAGVLQLNGADVQVGQSISSANAANLTFAPASSFVGNAFFTYTATDNQGATSVAVLYTIPVAKDNASVYTTTPLKGGTISYQNGDVIANVFDNNAGAYNGAAAVTDNGVRTASTDNSTLPPGTQLDPISGQITVYDRTLLVMGNYPVSITTVDANGGITTQSVPLQIGAYPLPVTLTRFDAEAVGLDGHLSWATAQEQNNAGFQVERSFDGIMFEPLAFVAGAGTSTRPLAYSFVDAGVGQQHLSTVYYRLQQRDLAGKVTYSTVRTVAFVPQRSTPSATLYPNPAAEQTTLDLTALPAGPYQVSVVDMTGRVVQTHTLAGGLAHTLLVGGLPSGSYMVLISNGELKFSPHLIKQ